LASSRSSKRFSWALSSLWVSLFATALIGSAPCAVASEQDFEVIYSFHNNGDGTIPEGGVVMDAAGNIFGTTFEDGEASSPGTIFSISPDGTERVLYHFKGRKDGTYPYSDLLKDRRGNLYGTTEGGGPDNMGVVFKLAPDGREKPIYTFTLPDTAVPESITLGRHGTLYGAAMNVCEICGYIYKLSKSGTETVLYTFTGGEDGGSPIGQLVEDAQGNLYGTTSGGGAYGGGVVFKLTPDGKETVLHAFMGGSDGSAPDGGLVADKAGNLYGTTYLGGGVIGGGGAGTVFKIAPDGTETVLYRFCSVANCADGWEPAGNLLLDSAGNIYGTTTRGADISYNGTIFKLAPDGAETVLHAFTGGDDGGYPNDLYQDTTNSEGYLYGTAGSYGAYGAGVVFKLKK
jgi:uncharacterized repeat protein (TIGR03803 family)